MEYSMNINLFDSDEEINRQIILDKEIDEELKLGNMVNNGKYRIYEIIDSALSNEDKIDALKNEYGVGGRSFNGSVVKEAKYGSKGIKYVLKNWDTVQFEWKDVLNRIEKLIRSGDYMLGYEIDGYLRWVSSPHNSVVNKTKTFEDRFGGLSIWK